MPKIAFLLNQISLFLIGIVFSSKTYINFYLFLTGRLGRYALLLKKNMKNFNYMQHDYMHYLSPIEILGYIAGVIISTFAFIPQVLKVWKGNNINGLSIGMYCLYATSLALWSMYAWLIDSHSLLITEVITGLLVGYILVKLIRKT